MINRQDIERIKADWQRILGADGSGKGAVCPICGSGTGKNGTGMSLIKGSLYELKCFACGESGDVIKIVCDKFGWSEQADFQRALDYCANAAGIGIDFDNDKHSIVKRKDGTVANEPAPEDIFDPNIRAECEENFKKWNAQLRDTDYWAKRGLSFDTVNHFNCGFAPDWKKPGWSQKSQPTPRFIIPNSPISYLARDTRSDDQLDAFWLKKKKVKHNRQGIFNFEAVKGDIIFIVEGEIDAMSLFEVGFHHTVGLGSISMVDKFISMLDRDFINKAIDHFPHAAVIALDNEDKKDVKIAKAKLIQKLNERGINTLDGTELSGECKDPNDMLVADREQLKDNCQRLFEQAKKLPKLPMGFVPTDANASCEAKPLGDGKGGKKDKTTKASLVLTSSVSTLKVLPDCPVDYNIPDGYNLSEDGLIVGDELIASRNAVVPVSFIINHHSRQQKIEIAIRKLANPESDHYKWENLIVDNSTISDKKKIIELTDRGLMTIAGDPAAGVVKFLFDMIALNAHLMPVREQFDQPGWSSELDQFRMPWNGKFYMPDLAACFDQRGDLQTWINKAKDVSTSSIAATMLAASFAAPLLRILDMRSFVIYLYGTSRFGKSACQKFALSVWGVPKLMMATYNATVNGLESIAARSNDLPLLIDESTEADKKKINLQMIPYMLAGGQGKTRMNRDLTARPTKQWLTIGLTNGEDALFDDMSKMGAMNRVLEIHLNVNERIFKDESAAAEVHKFVSKQCGYIGQDFIRRLLAVSDSDFAVVHTYYNLFYGLVKDEATDFVLEHIRLISILLTAWALVSVWYFGVPENKVIEQTLQFLGTDLLNRIPTLKSLDEGYRAKSIFIETIQSQKWHFLGKHLEIAFDKKKDVMSPIMGAFIYEDKVKDGETVQTLKEVRVLNSVAKKILSDAGFSANKILQEFAQRGWTDAQYGRIDKVTKWDGKPQRMIVIPGKNFTPDIE